jgi:phage-related protein
MALSFVPPVAPTPPIGITTTPNVLKATFGDLYSQRTPAGINVLARTASWSWANLTTSERDQIIAFFESTQGAQAFDYTVPNGGTTRWIATEWYDEQDDYENWNIRVELERVFDL